MIQIFDATSQNVPLIRQLAHQVWFVTYRPILPIENVDYLYNFLYNESSLTEQMEKKNHKFILAKDEAEYLEYAYYEISYKNLNKTKIHKMYVMPNAQGKGVGKELINSITVTAIENKNQI